MVLPSTYIQVLGQVPDFFKKIKEGTAPDKFRLQTLKDIGFGSSAARAFIPLLKAIGFLSDDGTPTPRYHAFRSNSESPAVMAQALREAYGDLFVIADPPTEKERELIEGKFKSAHNVSDRVAELMSKTFLALAKLADFHRQPTTVQAPKESVPDPISLPPLSTHTTKAATSLHYNIQIHLPPTKDIEVYNAIFRSLKEHLLD